MGKVNCLLSEYEKILHIDGKKMNASKHVFDNLFHIQLIVDLCNMVDVKGRNGIAAYEYISNCMFGLGYKTNKGFRLSNAQIGNLMKTAKKQLIERVV